MTKKEYRAWLENKLYGDIVDVMAEEIRKEVDNQILKKLALAPVMKNWKI